MTEKKKDPRPKWSSKKYKNYGEFNKAVLDWRERNNKGYKWNKKDVIWEVRNGKRVPVNRKDGKVLKFQERGIPGFIQDHINPKVIEFSNKPFGFDYTNLKGSDVYDEERRRFLTIGELKKDEAMRAEGRRIDEDLDEFETGEPFDPDPKEKLKVNKKKNNKEVKKDIKEGEGGGNEAGGGEGGGDKTYEKNREKLNESRNEKPAEFNETWNSDQDVNYNRVWNDSGQMTNGTRSRDNVGPARMTARERMRAQNVERHGEAHIAHLEAKDTAFQAMKRGEITKEKFIEDFPKSQTAKAARKKKLKIKK